MYLKKLLFLSPTLLLCNIVLSQTQHLSFGDLDVKKYANLSNTYYFIAGQKMYSMGTMDGLFPVNNTKNEERGIWAHPIKLMEGYEFTISEADDKVWHLDKSTHFEHEFHTCKFFYESDDFKVVREEFVAEYDPAMYIKLHITNRTNLSRTIEITMRNDFNIQPGWSSSSPNGEDQVYVKDEMMCVYDKIKSTSWGGVVGCDLPLAGFSIKDSIGIMRHSVELQPNETKTVTFLISVDSQDGVRGALNTYNKLKNQEVSQQLKKIEYYDKQVLQGVQFFSSDERINQAFLIAKANVLMSVMDIRPYYVAPFAAAGFPVYARLFGTDFCFSSIGLTAAGFADVTQGSLACMAHYTKEHLRAPHEVSSNGRMLGWDHVQINPQFIDALWQYFKWTNDIEFLRKLFPLCEETMEDLLATADADKDQYPEGPGLMEQGGMFPERLVTAAYMYPAYIALSEMANYIASKYPASYYKEQALKYREKFNTDWWNSTENMWAGSLGVGNDTSRTMDNFWSVVTPQKTGVASDENGIKALERVENEWVNDKWGLVGQNSGHDISNSGVGVVHNTIGATSAFRYGFNNLGWKLLQLSTKAPLDEDMIGLFDECQPSTCTDKLQLWSFGPFLEGVVCGLVGVNPIASEHKIEIYPKLLSHLTYYNLSNLSIGDHIVNINYNKVGDKHCFEIENIGKQKLHLDFIIAWEDANKLEINGKSANCKSILRHGVKVGRVSMKLSSQK